MKNKIITIMFISYIFIFSLLGIILKDKDISSTERRKLKIFPSFELNSEYINDVDKYLLDHFPFRDTFRSIKANFNYKVLKSLDNNGIYLKGDYIFKNDYPTNIESINNFIDVINDKITNLSSDNNVYIMIIPDKNYYLEDDVFLQIDYDYIYNEIDKLDITNIDIRNIMTLEDYYKTDTHWKQEQLEKVVIEMSKVMQFNYNKEPLKENIFNNFYGVYYGEAAINKNSDNLIYLTSESIDRAKVKYLEDRELDTVYNINNLESLDSYGIYLNGSQSFIEIFNDNSVNDKELVIFRDSFASSLTPLLVSSYKKITLIDIRYITSDSYRSLIDFTDQDVLFMYSTLIVNNSVTLRK